jgi:hypothetical protein
MIEMRNLKRKKRGEREEREGQGIYTLRAVVGDYTSSVGTG